MNSRRRSRFILIFLAAILALLGCVVLLEPDLPKEVVDAKYSSPASRFLSMDNGARVHYRDEGDPSDPPIVLVHGSNASLHTWGPWVGQLKNNYRVITMDLPGHGLTGAVPDRDYSMPAFVNTVSAVADHLEIPKFILGGNSMGGGVTWHFALAHPERVNALVLVDSSVPGDWNTERQSGNKGRGPIAFRLFSQPWFQRIGSRLDPYLLVVQGVRSAYYDTRQVSDDLVDRYHELSLREGSRQATLDRFQAFDPRSLASADLSVIEQPTLIMWGSEDALIPVDHAYRLERELINPTLVIYEEVGHVPMEEIPDRSAKDLIIFLNRALEPAQPSSGPIPVSINSGQ